MSPELVKQQSEETLKKHNIPIDESLPCIEVESELAPQSAQSLAARVVILSYMVGVGYGESGPQLKKALEKYDLYRSTSAEEQRLLSADKLSEQEIIDATWLAECIQALAWSLGRTDLDPFKDRDFDLSKLPDPFTDPTRFITTARSDHLRSYINKPICTIDCIGLRSIVV